MSDQPPAVPARTKDNLGITSMVLGVLSLILCSVVTGIPAVITGHMALSRVKKTPSDYGGKGLAIAGLIMGYVSIALLLVMIPIAAALLLPALAHAKAQAQSAACMNKLKQVSLSAIMYANEQQEKWPVSFAAMSNQLPNTKVLICPSDRNKTPANDWSSLSDANVSYEFLLRPEVKPAPQTPIFRCPIHGNVALGDGSVQKGQGHSKK